MTPPDVTALIAPPEHIVDLAIQVSTWSPCRSKRGSVVFLGENVIAHGHNYKPHPFACDGSAACKSTCRTDAVHAEQLALLSASRSAASGADMLHVKTVDGKLVPSGGPSCVQCSKLGLAVGVRGIWLYHESGWRFYEAEEWHRLSLGALLAASAAPQEPPLVAYMKAETRAGRSVAWLRLYAEKVRSGTAATFDIPNTLAQTIEDIATFIESAASAAPPQEKEEETRVDSIFPDPRMGIYRSDQPEISQHEEEDAS